MSNPPIDPIRERMVMSLFTRVGESLNILEETPAHAKQVHISQPVLLDSDIAKFYVPKRHLASVMKLSIAFSKQMELPEDWKKD